MQSFSNVFISVMHVLLYSRDSGIVRRKSANYAQRFRDDAGITFIGYFADSLKIAQGRLK